MKKSSLRFPVLTPILTLLVIVATAVLADIRFGAGMALLVVVALCMKSPRVVLGAYDNTVPAELTVAKILDTVLEEFVSAILPLKAFSLGVTNGRTLNALGTKTVEVPYIPAETAASKDFNAAAGDCYEVDPTDLTFRELKVDQRKYQSWGITSEQAAEHPILKQIDRAKYKARKLASDVIQNILSLVTAANYPQESVVGAAAGFDTDIMLDIRSDANTFKLPKLGRQAILNDDYETSLLKDNKNANEYGNSQPRWDAQMPRIAGFDIYGTTEGLDSTSDVDAGIVNFPSAILVAMAPIEPTAAIKQRLVDYRVLTHEESGISLVYKKLVDEWCDREAELVECTFGKAKGEQAALIRLVETATP